MAERAAIYCRISEDREGRGLGVRRQEKDGRALADRKGWTVAEVYVDNDVGAWSGKARPDYRRMLDDIKAGRRDAVIVWHLDRLTRRPVELEEFFEVCDAAGIKDLASCTGDVDLSTHDGRFMARILGAVARKESDDKSRRTMRKHLELAEAGRPVGGSRPFGWEDDRVTVRGEEAAMIRAAAARVLAGASLRGVAVEWNAGPVRPTRGGRWTQSNIRRILLNPRVAGHRAMRGVIVARAVWPPILDEGTWQRVRSVLEDPARRTNPAFGSRRYLLTGFLRCGRCGARLVSRTGYPSYGCISGADTGGCGGIRIVRRPLDDFVAAKVVERIDTPGLAVVSAPAEDEQALLAALADVDVRLQEAGRDFYGEGVITREVFLGAQRSLTARQADLRARLAALTRVEARAVLGASDAPLAEGWAGLPLDQQRALVGAVVDRVEVGAASIRNRFDPGRVRIVWQGGS